MLSSVGEEEEVSGWAGDMHGPVNSSGDVLCMGLQSLCPGVIQQPLL